MGEAMAEVNGVSQAVRQKVTGAIREPLAVFCYG